jgi:polyphosphate kinase
VAGLREQVCAKVTELSDDGMTAEEQLATIVPIVRELQNEHGAVLTEDVIPALKERGITLITSPRISAPEDVLHLRQEFNAKVFPVLTPLAVDPAHPFPYISNLSLSLAVILRNDTGEERFARVKVPKILARWIHLPGVHRYVPLELVIAANLELLFPGVEILGCYPFRITRNTDLEIDPDEADDLLALIQEEVRNRRFAEVVRLEIHPGMPDSLRQLLIAELKRRPGQRGPSADRAGCLRGGRAAWMRPI